MAQALAVLIRSVLVAAAGILTAALMNSGSDRDGGANIGAGLLAFAIIAVISLVWAVYDAHRSRAALATLLCWALVAVLVGIAMAVQIQFGGSEGIDGEVLRSDLLSVAPFVAGLVFVPAMLGTAAGAALGDSGRHRG